MKKTIYLLVMAMLCQNIKVIAQQSTEIKGQVTSTSGKPLAGATIKNKSGTNRVQTDTNGNFTCNSNSNSGILTISFLGYETKEIPFDIKKAKNINIILQESANALTEVSIVSTGYQNIPKERATGSFELLSNKTLNRKIGTDIISRLDGNSSVLFDNRSKKPNLQIRGLYTLTESISQPLIILDNFPYEGDINNINPNDVENVTILKDAAAASIWGARAGNGVIVINTKKGKLNQRIKVSHNSNFSFIAKPNLFELSVIPTSDYIDLEIQLFKKGAYNTAINNTRSRPALTPIVEILNNRRLGLISQTDSVEMIDNLRQNDVRNDFQKYIYRQQVNQQHQFDISGGSNISDFRISVGYDNNKYGLVGNNYNRNTFNVYNNIQPLKILSLQIGIQYTQSETKNNSTGEYGSSFYNLINTISSSGAQLLPIYSSLADNNGNHLTLDKYRKDYINSVGDGKLLDWRFKPLDELSLNNNSSALRSFLADFSIKVSPIKSLDFEIKYRYQRNAVKSEVNNDVNSYFVRNMVNLFTNLNAPSLEQKYPVPIGGILNTSEEIRQSHNIRGQLNYNKLISANNRIIVTSGMELREVTNNSSNQIAYGYNDRLSTSNIDFTTRFPRILGSATTITNKQNYGALNDRFVSIYANTAYTLKDRYILSASARNDATNLFGVKTQNKWKPLYSLGASWNISDESFYRVNFLPYLRLRTTYGYQGNINNVASGYTSIGYYPASVNSPINVPFADVNLPGNPELRWESVRQINMAIDYKFLNGIITGSFDFYLKKATDILSYEDADATTGYATILRNSANISGNGFEININSSNIQSKNFNWHTSFLLNYSSYRVTKYLVDNTQKGIYSNGQIITPLVGQSPYAIISYKFAGLDPLNGDPMGFVNGEKSKDWDYIINNTPLAEQTFQGSALPSYFGNVFNEFNIRGFSLSLNVMYKLKYSFRRPTINYNSLFTVGSGNSDYLKRWINPGDENHTNIPSMIYPNPRTSRDIFYNYSDATVVKGDNIRLQTIQLGYTIPQLISRKAGINQINLYMNIDDLNFIIWRANKLKIDPNYPGGIKAPKSISFGIRTSF